MSSRRKTKSSEQQLKTVKRLKRFVTTMEVIFGLLIVMMAVILFVPSVKTQVVKAMANTAIGQKIITWWGNNSYNESVRDLNFDDNSIKTNKLKYNYSEEYTNFVLFGVDSREGEVDASNSDSILIVSVHNTTGEVKMVSVYRDTYLGIYGKDGTIYKYFKVNSAYAGGGPEAAINTLNMNLDLNITDYVTVNFSGVAEIIDTLGGIKVNLTDDELQQLNYHMSSTCSSIGVKPKYVKKSGKNIKLNGIQATTYCRIRKATFYDPKTGEEVRDDFGRAARQRSVMMKLVEKAKSASFSELQEMVSGVMNANTNKNKIISTSFTFKEIVNMIPIIFDFKLSGSQGFPSNLETGTISGTSYVMPKGLSDNVSELHEYLFGEKNYQPTSTVNTIGNQIQTDTGVYSDGSTGIDMSGDAKKNKEGETESVSYVMMMAVRASFIKNVGVANCDSFFCI